MVNTLATRSASSVHAPLTALIKTLATMVHVLCVDPVAAESKKRLDALPHEILVTIFRYALVSPKQPVFFLNESLRTRVNKVRRRDKLAYRMLTPAQHSPKLDVLLASKALYFAGVEAYFGSSTLYLSNTCYLKQFIVEIGQDRKRHIKGVALLLEWPQKGKLPETSDEGERLLREHFASFTALQKVTVRVERYRSAGSKGYALTEADKAAFQWYVDRCWVFGRVEVDYQWS